MNQNRTLVLGIATTYRWTDVANFVVSLRSTGFNGDIALLVERKWLQTNDFTQFARHGVKPIEIFSILSRIPERIRRFRFSPAACWMHQHANSLAVQLLGRSRPHPRLNCALAWFHPVHSARFFFYQNLVEAAGEAYSHIVLSDVRAVIFQSDPERWQSEAPLTFFLETPRPIVAAEPTNARWISRMYGQDTLARIGTARVTCSGVFHAARHGMLEYLREMTQELASHAGTIRGEIGFDQGVHNFLLHSGRFPTAAVWENGEGLVLNMHGLQPDEWRVSGEGTVSTPCGNVVPVIHQYDRHPALKESIVSKFHN